MAINVETIDGSNIETGFWGPDITKVQLGDLAPITTQQFAGYAGLALADVIPTLNSEFKQRFAVSVALERVVIESLPTLVITGKFIAQTTEELLDQFFTVDEEDKEELAFALSAALAPTREAEYYPENPFSLQTDDQSVRIEDLNGTGYAITGEEFARFTFWIMRGGLAGWDQSGAYSEIRSLAERFDELLSADK
ncbi:MAG TPA: hypothetical protein VL989_02305 [Candidatus Sulfotelmatobacter sp.]|nr:hypothetical protein [Candidatus Sulfotelmatobacter sp.]